MKILVLMTHYCPWNNSIATTLSDNGHDVYVFDFLDDQGASFSNNAGEILQDLNSYQKKYREMNLVKTDLGITRYICYTPKLRSIAKRVKADLIFSLYGGGFGLMSYLSGIRPYALYVVGSDILLAGRGKKIINRLVLSGASIVFSNGEYLTEQARLQAPKANIMNLLLGLDLNKIRCCDFSRRPIRIVCTRSQNTVYNNDTIIRALSLLPVDVPEFQMIFVSGGPLLAETIALADKILSPTCRAKVHFVGGTTYANVLETLSQAHIFVSMSRSDGTSTAILEAMASGLFPILSDIPQNSIFKVNNVENCILIPLDDDKALADAILSALVKIDACGTYADFNRKLIERIADSKKNRAIVSKQFENIVRR
jgi:L-malate glycosyltransferase